MASILLAEDDEAMRLYLQRALERAGHEVCAVADGLQAMAELTERGFDLLLADIVMPGMDGVELVRRATVRRPEIRVVFITGFAGVALDARRQLGGEASVISKPFHLRDLVAQVERVLAR